MRIQKYIVLLIISFLIVDCLATVYTIGNCSATQYFSNTQLSCQECNTASNLIPLSDSNRCICQVGYKKHDPNNVNWNQACDSIPGTCTAGQVILDIGTDGSYLSTLQCKTCPSDSIPNGNYTKCIWCGPNSAASGNVCSCQPGSFTQGIDGCYDITSYGLNTASTLYSIYIPKAATGCFTADSSARDIQSCSLLMNLCLFSLLDMTNNSVCSSLKSRSLFFISSSDLNSYNAQPTLNIAQNTTKVYNLNVTLLRFYPNGSFVDGQSLRLGDLTLCEITNDTTTFKVGNNLKKSCQYNFNNILNFMSSPRYVSYVYSLLVADHLNNSYQVPVYINSNTDAVTRFFLQDTFSAPNSSKLTVASSITLQLTLSSSAILTQPQLLITYTQLPINPLTGALVTPVQSVSTSLSYSYDLTNTNQVIMPIFIVVNVLVLLHVSLRTYVAYKNKKSVFLFLPYLLQTWSTYMFFFLLIVCGYFFFFTKVTQQIYIFMPKTDSFYLGFYVVLGLMVLCRLISDFYQKIDIIKSEIYIIDWENSPERNSWRSMFIINSLVEFYTYRTISFFWALAWTVFFMIGLSWQSHTRETTELNISNISVLNPINPVLMYFLSASIFLVAGMVMKFFRRILVIWWPYPFEDFLDYCSLANISLFFCKRNAPIGYYLYATNQDRSQLTFKQINDMIAKGSLRKRRDFFADPIADSDNCQTFMVYIQSDFQTKINQLRRTEDMSQLEPINYTKNQAYKKVPFNIREEFVQKYLKKLLMTVPQEPNQQLQPTFLQNCMGLPPIQLNEHRELPTFIPSKDYQNIDLFPNSNEIHQLLTFIMLFTLFSVITQSCAIGAFISYFLFEVVYQWWIGSQTRKNIERFTKVKQGFML